MEIVFTISKVFCSINLSNNGFFISYSIDASTNQPYSYTIYSVSAKTDEPHFCVAFTDTMGEKVCTEISKELFDLLNQFELEDLSYLNEIDRHYAYLDQTELELHTNSLSSSPLPDDMFEYDDLYAAINKLPEKQRKRLTLYFFHDLTLEEIAKNEGVSFQTISKSIDLAIKKLSQIL